ncbi:MAG: cytidylate kinase-like family protein [Ignavibacteriales bacterium]|nr:cytidylate kinase-like family protein [Ignavibacteriales bacterium]
MIPVVSAYAKAKNYVEYHSQLTEQEMIQLKKKNPGVTLTISRQSGIDTNILCTKLDENFSDYYQTNWVYFDKELFEKVISDHNLPPRIQKFLTEQKVPAFSQMLNELLGIHPPIRKLIHKMASTILNLAEIGNVILIGRGANVISANLKNAYHVRLVAPLEERINFYLETTDVSRERAKKILLNEDENRRDFLFRTFKKDIDDPLIYNLTINVSKYNLEELTKTIFEAVKVKQYKRVDNNTTRVKLNSEIKVNI